MPSTPLTCCSIGAATVSATTWAPAPGYTVVTRMIGGAIWGYWATGSVGNATAPTRTMRIASTQATIGRRTKKRLSMRRSGLRRWSVHPRRRGDGLRSLQRRLHGHAVPGALEAVDDDSIRFGQSLEDDPQGPIEHADRHAAQLDHIILVDDQGVAAGLVREQRDVRHEHLVGGLEVDPHAHEQAGEHDPVLVLEPATHPDRAGLGVEGRVHVVD